MDTEDINAKKESEDDKDREREKRRDKDRDRDRSRDRDRDRERDRDRSRSSRHSRREKREHHSRRDRSRSKDRHGSRRSSRSRTRDRSRSRRRRHRSRSRSSRYDRSRSPRRERSVTPLHLKKRKLNNWDVPPPGYEGMTVAQVKATGHFPLGVQAPKVTDLVANTPVSQMQNMLNPDQTKRFAMATRNNPNIRQMNQQQMNLKQDKKLYVGNIPFGINEKALIDFFNSKMVEFRINKGPGDSVIGAQIEKNYAFIEIIKL
ncbi:hypothetical protein PIROE2DRAFT_57564 [Piromyces sp. E2]|nr:hypothetical protein PIROE2DRAFT_57564 [Piromyces sp. E2]|eukprot:OUM69193.1 hypothetical protein PIROE2DRAFT_57564 [Piromyces sp. E2]